MARKLRNSVGLFKQPHPAKVHFGGEDECIALEQDGRILLAVFDGVGGSRGVDDPQELVADFVRDLRDKLAESNLATMEMVDVGSVQEIFHDIHKGLTRRGASTACIVTIGSDGRTACGFNLGDSGFLVYRRGYIVLSSRPQQLEFNCPFQLAAQGEGHTAYDADVDNFVTEPGDIIVLATDGVWDNLFLSNIRGFLRENGERLSAAEIAQSIGKRAVCVAADPDVETPFELCYAAVRKQEDPFHDDGHGLQPLGGKVDDVSVVAYKVPYPSASSSHETGPSMREDELILEAGVRQVFGRGRRGWMAQPEVQQEADYAVASEVTECPESLPIQEAMDGATASYVQDGHEDDNGIDTSGSPSHQSDAVEALEDGADQVLCLDDPMVLEDGDEDTYYKDYMRAAGFGDGLDEEDAGADQVPSVGHTTLEDASTSTSNGDAGDEEGYIENYMETSGSGSHQAAAVEALEDGADQVLCLDDGTSVEDASTTTCAEISSDGEDGDEDSYFKDYMHAAGFGNGLDKEDAGADQVLCLDDNSTSTSGQSGQSLEISSDGEAGDEDAYIEDYTETSAFGSHQAAAAEALEDGADQVPSVDYSTVHQDDSSSTSGSSLEMCSDDDDDGDKDKFFVQYMRTSGFGTAEAEAVDEVEAGTDQMIWCC